jgi:prepilin-type N-terminal cleavage/methylation domain-containing protein
MVIKRKGLTLIELIVAMTMLSVVILTSSAVLINFKKFYKGFSDKQAVVGEVSLAFLEDITNKVFLANELTINPPDTPGPSGSSIAIRVDNSDPSSTADDTVYTYWYSGTEIQRKSTNPTSGPTTVAKDVSSLKFETQPAAGPSPNYLKITVEIRIAGGGTEKFETNIVARCRCAEG